MVEHKTHRTVLYTFVVALAILQLITFLVLSAQITRLNAKIDSDLIQTKSEIKQNTNSLIQEYDKVYQDNFNEILGILAQQQANVKKEMNLLKSSVNEDFSSVAQESVKSVLTITTEGSMGSGFVVNDEGYIVTNYHVIAGNEQNVRVLTPDKTFIDAEFIGKDSTRDIAVLKVNSSLPALELDNSDELQVGRRVIAIGNPLGLSFTVTEGIISGLHRSGPNGLNEYIQTDVSLNPGNSGGPLINTDGKVIGINNFKIGGAESLGFSLESNALKKAVNKIANQTIVSS